LKILFVCHRFPFPPQRGGKIRPFNIVKHLSANHEVTVASLVRSKEEAKAGTGLKDYCHDYLMSLITLSQATINALKRLPSRSPFSMGYFYSGKLDKQIQKNIAAKKYDLIMVHCSSVAQYVEDIKGVPKIMDFGDMDSQKWLIYSKVRNFPKNLLFAIEGKRLMKAEADLAKKFTYCSCTTEEEMGTLDRYGVSTPKGWFPNGVDTEFFKPGNEPYDNDSICFLGRMDYYPNQESMLYFCTYVFPQIRLKRPSARLYIIGADPPKKIRDLGNIPGVEVTGSVKDVRPYVQKCAVNVAPINIARGTQNKILESLAMGVPTVASAVAARGVDCVPEEHILSAVSTEGYVDAILRLMADPNERQRFAEAGRARMLSRHSWESSMKRLDQIIIDCIESYQKEERKKQDEN
jgi:polysaccharide biosynthesis protein PslH